MRKTHLDERCTRPSRRGIEAQNKKKDISNNNNIEKKKKKQRNKCCQSTTFMLSFFLLKCRGKRPKKTWGGDRKKKKSWRHVRTREEKVSRMLNFQIILLLRNAHRRKTEGQKVKEDYKELVFNFLVMWVCVCVWRLSSVHAPAAKRKKNSIFFLVQHHLLCTFPAARHMASIRFPSLFALYGTQQVELQKKKRTN